MNVYCLVTPSHEILLENWFRRTLPADCRPQVHLVPKPAEEYGQGGWHRVVAQKFNVLERAFTCEPENEVFILSDVDIRFYRPFTADISRRMLGYDLLFQHNRPSLSKVPEHICTGFMAIPNNPYSRAFARHARRWLEICDHPEIGDQNACIEVLRRSPDCLTFGFPPVSYWSPGSSLGRWLPGRRLKPPRQMILHHANHTVGIGHKIQQLRTVEAMFTALPQTAGAVAVQRP